MSLRATEGSVGNIMQECKQCLLQSGMEGVYFDSEGFCNYCSGETPYGILDQPEIKEKIKNKDSLYRGFLKQINEPQGKKDYDCLVALSGGKDSAYFLYWLQKNTDLRILSINVDTGFESSTAFENIKRVTEKLSIKHITLNTATHVFNKIYRFYLTNQNLSNTVNALCDACTALWHSMLIRTAAEYEIPFLYI